MGYLRRLLIGLLFAMVLIVFGVIALPCFTVAVTVFLMGICAVLSVAVILISILNLWLKLDSIFEDCNESIPEPDVYQ